MLNPGARSRVDSESGTREVSNLIPGWKASEPGCQLCLQTLDPVLSSVSCCSLAFMAYVHSFGQHISQAVSKLSTYSLPGPMDTSHFPLQIMRSMTLTYLSPSSRPQSAIGIPPIPKTGRAPLRTSERALEPLALSEAGRECRCTPVQVAFLSSGNSHRFRQQKVPMWVPHFC